MQLTRGERLILANQYSILAKLEPENAAAYGKRREIVANGYGVHYGEIAEEIDAVPLSDSDIGEVHAVLEMHKKMQAAYKGLSDKSGIEWSDVQFRGFSGNDEAKQLTYAAFALRLWSASYEGYIKSDGLDAHMPMLGIYRRMSAVYAPGKSLDKNSLLGLIAARKAN